MFEDIYKPIEDRKTYRCPCCKYKTLFGRGGYELCPVCFWEDDGQDEHDADEIRGGPNGVLGLRQAQDNFQKFRAMEKCFAQKVRELKRMSYKRFGGLETSGSRTSQNCISAAIVL